MEPLYNPKDIAEQLGIKENTLRKYAVTLEKSGYVFHRNEHGSRGYRDGDAIAIKKLISIKKQPGMTVEKAAKAVVTWSKGQNVADSATEIDLSSTAIKEDYVSKELFENTIRMMMEKHEETTQKLIMQNKAIQYELSEIKNAISAPQNPEKSDKEKTRGFFKWFRW